MVSERFQFGFTVFMVGLLCIAFLALGRQVGFSDGARETTDQILSQQTQSSEVIELRARLDEQRRAEVRISTVVMTAFGAAISVLVLVNAGLVIGSVLNFQREKDALKTEFLQSAKELDAAQLQRLQEELRGAESHLRSSFESQSATASERLSNAETRIDAVVKSIARVDISIDHLYANSFSDLGKDAEAKGHFVSAAQSYARAARRSSRAKSDGGLTANLNRAYLNLEQAAAKGRKLTEKSREVIEEMLQDVEQYRGIKQSHLEQVQQIRDYIEQFDEHSL